MARRPTIDEDPGVVLPITPMLDMAFQLLAFFIFTYHPSDLEGQMEMFLPDKTEAQAKEQQQNPVPSDAPDVPNIEADISVILRTQHDGQRDGDISQIIVRDRTGQDQTVETPQELSKLLAKLREGVDNKDGVKLQGDGRLKWAKVVEIMDVCRKAGFKDVGFAPPPDLQPGIGG
jgi:biopolymer transport protein ExbD